MKKLLIIFLILSGFSCNPYRSYYFTHYHIIASYDPATTVLSANVQLVFIPRQEYHDSITFQLNDHMEIQSLTAQELKYYEFEDGRLVLYIEEAVMPGDQLHISLNYSGMIGNSLSTKTDLVPDPALGLILGPDQVWYPVNPYTEKLTYFVEIGLPEAYSLDGTGIRKGRKWQLLTEKPLGSIKIPLVTE